MWQQVPDIDHLDQVRANQDPDWVTVVLRGIGEMGAAPSLAPDPGLSWIDLSRETDQFGMARAYVHLVATSEDLATWTAMDRATFDLAARLSGGDPKNIEYLDRRTGAWLTAPPQPDATGGGPWRDPLGSTHHEAGTLFMGAPDASVTDTNGRFHHTANAYAAGPALFPTLGSANPSLTALTLARRTTRAIVTEHTLSPPRGFRPLSLDPADWHTVAAPGTGPAIRHLGPILEMTGGYGLHWYIARAFGDAAFWIEWRELHVGDNSGVYVRVPDPSVPDALHQADVQGYEIQIDDLGAGSPAGQGIHRTAAVYGLHEASTQPIRPAGDWNSYLIDTKGNRIRVTLNGTLVNDYTGDRGTNGYLTLQAHSGTVQFRNLQARTSR
jgi:hypothetical protein